MELIGALAVLLSALSGLLVAVLPVLQLAAAQLGRGRRSGPPEGIDTPSPDRDASLGPERALPTS